MKRIAIILGLLLSAQCVFAGGTMLMLDSVDGYNPGNTQGQGQTMPLDPNAVYYTQNGIYNAADDMVQTGTKKTYKKAKFRLGKQNYNDPNVYWNFGRVNFGNGFTTVGGGDKKY